MSNIKSKVKVLMNSGLWYSFDSEDCLEVVREKICSCNWYVIGKGEDGKEITVNTSMIESVAIEDFEIKSNGEIVEELVRKSGLDLTNNSSSGILK